MRQAAEKLAGYLKRLDEGDADEDAANTGGSGPGRGSPRLAEKIAAVRGKRERHKALLEELVLASAVQLLQQRLVALTLAPNGRDLLGQARVLATGAAAAV